MKKFILFYSALFTLTGCETLNSTYTQFSQSMQDSLGGTSVLPTSSCVTSGKGFEKFYNCSLSEVAYPYNNGTYGEVYQKLRDEIESEFGQGLFYTWEHSFVGMNFSRLIYDRMIANDSEMQEIIFYLGEGASFHKAAYLMRECKTFNESNYRAELNKKYGRVGADKVELEIAKLKKTCTWLTAKNTPLSNAKYALENYQKWYLKTYVNNK